MRRLASTLIVLVLALAGCDTSSPASPPERTNAHQATFFWIANPAVDLMSPEATFIRGITESWVLAFAEPGGGLSAHPDDRLAALRAASYPGFEEAFNNAWEFEGWVGNAAFGNPRVGTDYFEVIELHRNGGQYSATICNYPSMTAAKNVDDGQYGGLGAGSGQVMSMTFGPDPALPAGAQRAPLAQQRGPARKPSDDVFGTWIATEFRGLTGAEPRCEKLAPGTPPNVPKIYDRPGPPPTLPPEPGWPSEPQQ